MIDLHYPGYYLEIDDITIWLLWFMTYLEIDDITIWLLWFMTDSAAQL